MPQAESNLAGALPATGRLNAGQWRVLLLLMAFAALCHFNRVGMSVAGTERLMKEFHFSEAEMGFVYSAYLFVYMSMMIPGGLLIERIGPRAALGWMGLSSGLLVILTGLPGWGLIPAALAWPAFMLIRGALGFAVAPLHPAAARSVSFWIPESARNWGNGMVVGAAGIGIASQYILFGVLMDKLTWPGTFLMSGLVMLAVSIVWLLTTTDRPAGAPEATISAALRSNEILHEIGVLLKNRSLILTTISYVTFGYLQFLFLYWMQYYFKEVLLTNTADSRIYSTIVGVSLTAGMISGGWLSDRMQLRLGVRWGRAAVAFVGMAGSAIVAVIGIQLNQTPAVVTCFALAMGLIGMCEAPFWTTAVEQGGRRGGLAAAIMNTGGNIGGTLSPFTTPLIANYFGGERGDGWKVGFELACGFCLIGAILWIWITPVQQRGSIAEGERDEST